MPVEYGFTEKNEFMIRDYDRAKTFASFLPGIAGIDGIPMWSFYVNRGQVMGSFGVKDKNGAIMEFFPANLLYRNIEHQGFRTFIRKDGKIHEIFSSVSDDLYTRSLFIERNVIKIIEDNQTLDLRITVTYFTMPGENYAALVRKVETERIGNKSGERDKAGERAKGSDVENHSIEILDGLPQIIPAGTGNGDYQAMANLMKSWFDVFNLENDIAFYKTRGSTADTAEVNEQRSGNFYLSFSNESSGLIPPIYDMNVIFGENTAFSRPDGWTGGADELHSLRQVPENKVSGGFSGVKTTLEGKLVLCTLIGHVASPEIINAKKDGFTVDYINKKEKEARDLVDKLVQDTYTKTTDSMFDNYISQCYLDNFLRGGYPYIIRTEGKNLVYHLFSRKHGDTEREYNFFSLEPNYYSQGNGNFRDVNQNRRNDVLIRPEVGDFNVKHMMSLIQADGYNPLVVKGCTFLLDKDAEDGILMLVKSHKDEVGRLLSTKFTPGSLISFIEENGVKIEGSREAFLEKVLAASRQEFEAEFGEGYWSDHWTYNMDLVEGFLNIYPDRKEELLFGDSTYRFFQSPVFVLPRSDKYVLAKGKVRQYGAITEADGHSAGSLKETAWLKTQDGKGAIYEANLFEKLVSLALNKFVNLDPFGMGIEMEANKPGWCDAMNGLPGIFGSGLSETIELKRITDFLAETCREYDSSFDLFAEEAELLDGTIKLLEGNLSGELDDFTYWDRVSALKETYRSSIRSGIEGSEKKYGTRDLLGALQKMDRKLEAGLNRALTLGNGIYPTYFTYEAAKYEVIEGKTNPVNGYQNVKVTGFECRPLPLFLEAPARAMGSMEAGDEAEKLYKAIKASGIYDSKLKMYKTSEPLGSTSSEIGRLKSFTPGWLEREAVFMHMEYKYLLAMLKAGLYNEFFEDIRTMLVPFMKPEVYGRSTLENSSFIASSVNPDEAVHGRGYVSRMSGTTAEALSIWFIMMAGKRVFSYENGELVLNLAPILPGWLFDKNGKVSFKLLGNTLVTYSNPGNKDTYGGRGAKPVKFVLTTRNNRVITVNEPVIRAPYAEAVRKGEILTIDVLLGV